MNAVAASDSGLEDIGPYRILQPLSSGGSRGAALAVDEAGRRVVLEDLGTSAGDRALLDPKIADAARSYARLSHPNVVQVVDLFSTEGSFVIALEYVEGPTLDGLHAALARTELGLDAACWIYLASSIFAALAAAHGMADVDGNRAPIVHRRIAPSHVHVAWDGTIKLGGFSVVNVVNAAHEPETGVRDDSRRYLAPEQTEGMGLGPHTDVYSAALVLWELLAGRRVTANPNIPPLDVLGTDIDARVRDVVQAALEPDPAKRVLSAARARDVLRSSIDMAAAGKRFAAALARLRSETAMSDAPVPEGGPAELSSVDDAPTIVRPRTDEELRAISGVQRSQSAARIPPHLFRIALRIALGVAMCMAVATLVVRAPLFGTRQTPPPLSAEVALPAAAAPDPVSAPAPNPASPLESPRLHSDSPANASSAGSSPQPELMIPPDLGELRPPSAAAGHRILIDGRTVGEGTAPLRVGCGPHTVRIGSAGRLQRVNVPCGRALELAR